MDTVTQVEISDEVISISDSANTFDKGMRPTIITEAMGKWYRELKN